MVKMKNVKINVNGEVVKVKVFEKNDVIEKLARTKEEWNLVNAYQKKFWQLLQDENGFCVDGEDLCNELEVKSNFNDWLLRKSKGKEGKLIRYRCVEGVDYILDSISDSSEKGGRPKNIIKLTLDCAKKIAMRQNNEQGDLVCNYFILMEKSIRDYQKWESTREPQKQGNNVMKDVIKSTYEKRNNKSPDFYVYCTENDMLNQCLTGMKAKQLQNYLGMNDKNTRNHLTEKINNALSQLQFLNTSLIASGMDLLDRRKIIQNTVDMNFSDVKDDIEKVRDIKAS